MFCTRQHIVRLIIKVVGPDIESDVDSEIWGVGWGRVGMGVNQGKVRAVDYYCGCVPMMLMMYTRIHTASLRLRV